MDAQMKNVLEKTKSTDKNNYFNRPLGAFEKFFWLLDQDRPMQFALAAEIEGISTPREWRFALDAAQRRHPLLSVFIDGHSDKIVRFGYLDKPIPMRIIDKDMPYSWDADMAEELARPFDYSQAPLIRAVLVQQELKSTLILVAHHSISDGISLTNVLRDILKALSGQTLEPLPMPPSMDDLVGLTVGTRFDPAVPYTTPATKVHPILYHRNKKLPLVQRLKLPQWLTRKITLRAREEGTTVHGALCAAFVLAGREVFSDWNNRPTRLLIPASNRNVINMGEASSLSINSTIVTFEPAIGSEYWDLARFAKNSITGLLELENIIAGIIHFRQHILNDLDTAGVVQMVTSDLPHEMMLTNMGRFNYDTNFGPFKLTELWGPFASTGYTSAVTTGIVTVNDYMFIALTSYEPLKDLLSRVEVTLINLFK
jgi:hypothetical protein